jgi:hypothetical protein
MESSSGYLCGLVVLSVLFALSLGAAAAVNDPVSVGTDITKIIGVNYQDADQWVEIANEGTGSMDLSFPANFTLKAGSLVRVHEGLGNNTAADLFNSTLLWSKEGDAAALKDAAGKIVSEYEYPVEVSAPGSVTKTELPSILNTSSISGMSRPFLPDYKSGYGAERGGLKSSSPVNLTGHSFICHGGPLNWAWTSGLR